MEFTKQNVKNAPDLNTSAKRNEILKKEWIKMKKATFNNTFNARVCQKNFREQSLNVENVYTLLRQTCIGNVMI